MRREIAGRNVVNCLAQAPGPGWKTGNLVSGLLRFSNSHTPFDGLSGHETSKSKSPSHPVPRHWPGQSPTPRSTTKPDDCRAVVGAPELARTGARLRNQPITIQQVCSATTVEFILAQRLEFGFNIGLVMPIEFACEDCGSVAAGTGWIQRQTLAMSCLQTRTRNPVRGQQRRRVSALRQAEHTMSQVPASSSLRSELVGTRGSARSAIISSRFRLSQTPLPMEHRH